jgi:hypothetical protein
VCINTERMGKADRVKKRTRKGKRMFQGNQFTRMNTNSDLTPPSSQQQTPIKTVSSTKVQTFETDTPGKKDKFIDGYRFVDMEILSIVISVLSCPVCQLCLLTLRENFLKKWVLLHSLSLNVVIVNFDMIFTHPILWESCMTLISV